MLLQQKVIERSQARRVVAVARYRELLARGEHPRSGDDDAFIAVLGELGRKMEDADADGEVVCRMAAAEQTIMGAVDAESAAQARVVAATRASTAAQEEQSRADAVAKAALEAYEAACHEANGVLAAVSRARGDLRDGELYFRALLERRSLDEVRKTARKEEAEASGLPVIHGSKPRAPVHF